MTPSLQEIRPRLRAESICDHERYEREVGLLLGREAETINLHGERVPLEFRPSRILSVGSSVIVPRRILAKLPLPAYNLHPGPPNYPGIFPSAFALYEGAREFGVTLHEMAAIVDSGAICMVERFKIDPRWDRLSLDTHTFVVLMHVLERTAPHGRCARPSQ